MIRIGLDFLSWCFALLAVTFVCGCARANYQDDVQSRVFTAPADKSTACTLRLEKAKLCAAIAWVEQPSDDAMGSFSLTFTPLVGGLAIDPAGTVKVKVWMPSMGHGSAPTQVTRKTSGVYDVTNVYFSMPGQWQIVIMLMDGATVADQVVENLTY